MGRNKTTASNQSGSRRSSGGAQILLALAAIVIGGSGAHADTLYKCTNAQGSVLYTNQGADRAGCTLVGSYPDGPAVPPQRERKEPAIRPECTGQDCSLKISKSNDGHFYVDGAVNGTKVRFLVDTGASVVVMNPNAAFEANVHGSRNVQLQTAGGTVSGSMASNVPISIANLPTINTEVAINPSLDGRASLLGQSYLKMFKVTIQGSTMELSQ
jgi:clan AA aspartic protease (TIGR02281 family)